MEYRGGYGICIVSGSCDTMGLKFRTVECYRNNGSKVADSWFGSKPGTTVYCSVTTSVECKN